MEFDLSKLMQQAQRLQRELQGRQEELARKEVEGEAGAGLVRVTANGRGEILKIRIDPKTDFSDPAMLEDLLVAGINAALQRVHELQQRELSNVTGGFPIPGLSGLGSPPDSSSGS